MDDLFAFERSHKPEVLEFVEYWNSKIFLPRIRGTPRQFKEIGRGMSPYFIKNYKEAISEIAKSKFIRGSKGFRLTIDWFLIPDNLDKLLEGKYRDEDKIEKTIEQKTFLDEFGNERIL